jgi:hypothetical protein
MFSFSTRGYTPTLAMFVSFNVGSADDASQIWLAHMLFKGTERFGSINYGRYELRICFFVLQKYRHDSAGISIP